MGVVEPLTLHVGVHTLFKSNAQSLADLNDSLALFSEREHRYLPRYMLRT
jgi:hypothetical protein